MRHQRQKTVAFVTSIVAHLFVVLSGALGWGPSFDIPEIELEFTEVDLIDPDAEQGEGAPPPEPKPPEVVEPPPPAQTEAELAEAEAARKAEEEAKKKAEEEAKKNKEFGKKNSKVDQLAPAGSTFHMMLAARKVRKLPFAQEIVDLMSPWPDFEYFVEGGEFRPLEDFNFVVIASPDIRDAKVTFLAVDYRMSRDELKAGIDKAAAKYDQSVRWAERDGVLIGDPEPNDPENLRRFTDDRVFALLEGHVAVYVQAQFLKNILEGDTGKKTAGNFVANLARIKRFAAREPKAGMQLVAKDFRQSLKRTKVPVGELTLEVPDSIEIMAEAAAGPRMVWKLRFATGVDAKAFEQFWNDLIPKIIDSYGMTAKALGVMSLYKQIELIRSKNEVRLEGEVNEDQAKALMGLFAQQAKAMRKRRDERQRKRRAAKGAGQTDPKGGPSGERENGRKPTKPLPNPAGAPTQPKPGPAGDAPAPSPPRGEGGAGKADPSGP